MDGCATFTQLGRYGRFANQFFQWAGTMGIARKNALRPLFPVWRNYDHVERFGSKEDINVFEHFVNALPLLDRLPDYHTKVGVPWGYHDIKLESWDNYDISGHLQSPRYFEHCIDEVRHYATMKAESAEYSPHVAIHARRGDYDNKYHPVIPVEWYVKAIQYFPASVKFLVFSDLPIFVSQLSDALTIHGLNSYANRLVPIYSDYLRSFAIMKKCSHFIIGNSSYSAAAAILADVPGKQVIAPRNWFGTGYAGITGDDIYGNDWKIL